MDKPIFIFGKNLYGGIGGFFYETVDLAIDSRSSIFTIVSLLGDFTAEEYHLLFLTESPGTQCIAHAHSR